jgi:hypothetical protein
MNRNPIDTDVRLAGASGMLDKYIPLTQEDSLRVLEPLAVTISRMALTLDEHWKIQSDD